MLVVPSCRRSASRRAFVACTVATAAFLVGVGDGARAGEGPLGAFGDVALGATPGAVRDALDGSCATWRIVRPGRPDFPLARESETYLICRGARLAGEPAATLDAVAFTFADDALVSVEARGGAAKALPPRATGDGQQLAGFRAYPADGLVAHAGRDTVWLLGPEALHAHLFLRSNPLLEAGAEDDGGLQRLSGNRGTRSISVPDVLEFGGSLDTIAPRLEAACAASQVRRIDEVWLATEPDVQTQVDCYGLDWGGWPRKVEAVFGDGVLELAWILTGPGEEDRLRQALTAAHGKPVHVDDTWEAFAGWRVVLRKDKPEVLLLSERAAPLYREKATAAP